MFFICEGTLGLVNITGAGFMADLDRAILRALKPLQDGLPLINTTKCMEPPKQPDYSWYALISKI